MSETATDSDRLGRDLRKAAKLERRLLANERRAERRLAKARGRLDKSARRLEAARAVYDERAGRVAELESALVVAQAERAAGSDAAARPAQPDVVDPPSEAPEPPAPRRRSARKTVDHGTHVHLGGNTSEPEEATAEVLAEPVDAASAGPASDGSADQSSAPEPSLHLAAGAPVDETPEALEVRRVDGTPQDPAGESSS